MSDEKPPEKSPARRTLARVGSSETFASGIVLTASHKTISLFPFEDDKDYTVKLEIDIWDKDETNLSIDYDKGASFTLFMPWQAIGVANLDIPIAVDGEYAYFVSFAVMLIGTPERYAVNLNYSFSRAPLDV